MTTLRAYSTWILISSLFAFMVVSPLSADRHNWPAQLDAADRFYNAGDYIRAREIYEYVASETANPYAQFQVAWIYDNALGTPRNCREAARWYTLAANSGVLAASNNLYVLYLNGCLGFPKNETFALFYLNRAADGNDSRAQANLAGKYLEGDLVEKNVYRAYDLARKSAQQNDPWGLLILSEIHDDGLGVPSDSNHAYALLTRLAAMEFHAAPDIEAKQLAQLRLAYKSVFGEGTTASIEDSYYWFLLAAAGNDEAISQEARAKLEELRPKLTPAEARQVERRAQREIGRSTSATVGELQDALAYALKEKRLSSVKDLGEVAAEQDIPIGFYALGQLFTTGSAGYPVDSDEAFIHFKRSCDGGFWLGCIEQARHLHGMGRHQELAEFLPALEKSRPTDIQSTLLLANLYAAISKNMNAEEILRSILLSDPNNQQASELLNELQR